MTRVLEPMRERWGLCVVVSGFRTPAYNASVGGAALSAHQYGEGRGLDAVGADVRFARGTPASWAVHADQLLRRRYPPGGGLGTYHGAGAWVHVDTRSYLARWSGPA